MNVRSRRRRAGLAGRVPATGLKRAGHSAKIPIRSAAGPKQTLSAQSNRAYLLGVIEFIEAVLEEAIAHGMRAFANVTLGGQSIGDCIGPPIEGVDWSDTAFRLRLTNGLALTVRLHDREIDVDVERELGAPGLGDSTIAESVTVRLGPQEFVWDRAMLMRSLVGDLLTRSYLYQGSFSMLTGCKSEFPLRSWGLHLAKKVEYDTQPSRARAGWRLSCTECGSPRLISTDL